ncbi:hypothetical protein [Fictibacillus terranigra]|uniref:hypothetical protein n=1 Tax=Fictibacillus terranigra TaxID=3058424 RepID=UPI003CD0CA83
MILQKYRTHRSCQVTGEIHKHNFSIANGKIFLSKNGAQLLLEELQKVLHQS